RRPVAFLHCIHAPRPSAVPDDAGDAMTETAFDAAESLRIEMEHVARRGVFVSMHRRRRIDEGPQDAKCLQFRDPSPSSRLRMTRTTTCAELPRCRVSIRCSESDD